MYPITSGRIRPYGGIGLGYAAMRADFGWNWRRNADSLAITTGRDQSNFDEIRVSGRSVRFCTLSGAFLTSVEVPIDRRAVDTKLLCHLTC